MSRGCTANEPMFIKCFEDEKFHARAEGVCCYFFGGKLKKGAGVQGRGNILPRSSPRDPRAVQPGWLCSALLVPGACRGRSASRPFVHSQADPNPTPGFGFVWLVAGGGGGTWVVPALEAEIFEAGTVT